MCPPGGPQIATQTGPNPDWSFVVGPGKGGWKALQGHDLLAWVQPAHCLHGTNMHRWYGSRGALRSWCRRGKCMVAQSPLGWSNIGQRRGWLAASRRMHVAGTSQTSPAVGSGLCATLCVAWHRSGDKRVWDRRNIPWDTLNTSKPHHRQAHILKRMLCALPYFLMQPLIL